MKKKPWSLIVVMLVLAGIYVYCFTGWFKPKILQISYTNRPLSFRRHFRAGFPTMRFGFGGQRYRLSEIEVVPLAAWQTNQSTTPLWCLIANLRSAPVGFFWYGQNFRGMKPAVPGARPDPLESNVIYRLFVRAGSYQGHCDFQLSGRPPPASKNQ